MSREELIENIYTDEPAFTYKGKNCLINLNGDFFEMYYGGQQGDPQYFAKDIDDALAYPLFDGKSLNDICEQVEFW